MRRAGTLGLVVLLAIASPVHGQDRDARVAEIDRRLTAAREQARQLQHAIEALSAELQALRAAPAPPPAAPTADKPANGYYEQIVRPELAHDERGHEIEAMPELFIQARFQAAPIEGATIENAPSNFNLSRMESRWAGRVSPKVGIGFEIQFHPAPAGAPEELVNDAFLEYYPTDRLTLRAGLFVKPFGFDVQQSSSEREAPERGIFAGYFVPGQRDRGAMVAASLEAGVRLYAGVFDGNRFFADNNRRLNYNLRARKIFDGVPLAAGVSAQFGHQLLPEGMAGTANENLFGADLQWAWRRLGLRAEIVTGNMPSTLLGLETEFAPAFTPDARSSGGALFGSVRLTGAAQMYARYDQFNGDPVFGYDVRAVDVGYLHWLGEHSRIGVDYQFKNRVSMNDDRLNTRLMVSFNVVP